MYEVASGVRLRNIWKASKGIAVTAALTIFVVASLRIFLFASFSIPSASMQPTVLPGDQILVNKLVPGPRMDWLYSNAAIGNEACCRIKGSRDVKRGDVLVFNAPYHRSNSMEKNLNVYYVKRCVGLPGDSLCIKDGAYHIKNDGGSFSFSLPSSKPITDTSIVGYRPKMFKALDWTLTAWGSAYIPRKGDDILLDSTNIHLYKNLIEYETGGKISLSDGTYHLDQDPYPRHKFKQNYYFLAGDNAVDSEDSRFWGLLPEGHIVGKASYIWKSIDPDTRKYRFDRFLKPID